MVVGRLCGDVWIGEIGWITIIVDFFFVDETTEHYCRCKWSITVDAFFLV